jgi:hypothetical protein
MSVYIVVGEIKLDYKNDNCNVCDHLQDCKKKIYFPKIIIKNIWNGENDNEVKPRLCCEDWWPRKQKEGINETR